MREFNVFIGLEMGMLLMPFNAIRDYWDRSHFRGHPTFYETMGGDRFKTIRANLQVHEPFTEGVAFLNRKDPLYYIRNEKVLRSGCASRSNSSGRKRTAK